MPVPWSNPKTFRKYNQSCQHWILRLNADGPQKHLRQRPEFAVALEQCLEMQDAHLTETQQCLRPIRPEHQQRQRQDQQFEGGEKLRFSMWIRKVDGGTSESHGKPAGSVFIFNFAVAKLTMANELELMVFHII